jgi:DNA-binding Lrp family transcriptional regulator
MPSYTERDVNKALAELRDNPETPIRRLADRFNIPRATLQNRLLKTKDTYSGREKL